VYVQRNLLIKILEVNIHLCVFLIYRNMTPPMLLKLKFVCEKDLHEMQEMINEKRLAVTTPQLVNNRRREPALRKEAMLNAVQQLVSFQLQKRCTVTATPPARPAPPPLPENYAGALTAWRGRQAADMLPPGTYTVITVYNTVITVYNTVISVYNSTAFGNESKCVGQYFPENLRRIRRPPPIYNHSGPVMLVQGMTRLTLPSGQVVQIM